jgi:tetraacyldisaccharide 4'-kinase
MRGYRKSGASVSDEQRMLQQLLPGTLVEANPDRIAGARAALSRQPETTCFVLDDGFQHRRARRDFDLVLIHAANPFGFGHVHPRGLLREPLCGLKRATAILITHASEVPPEALLQTQQTIQAHTSAPIFHCDHLNDTIISADDTQTRELSDLATIPFTLCTGIGQPQALAASLQRFPAAFKSQQIFDDHHHYTSADLDLIARTCHDSSSQAVITTEKDWVKLKPLWLAASRTDLPPLYRLQLHIRFWEGEETVLLQLITASLARSQPQ